MGMIRIAIKSAKEVKATTPPPRGQPGACGGIV